MTSSEFEVAVLGDGIVGLACARAIAQRGRSTVLVGRRRPGVASVAAAGFLAPTVEPARGRAFPFTVAARDRYRSFLEELRSATGSTVPFALDGVLRIAASEREAVTLGKSLGPSIQWLSPAEVGEIEPALHAPYGGTLHADDGMVDNQRLLQLLEAALDAQGVPRQHAQVMRVELEWRARPASSRRRIPARLSATGDRRGRMVGEHSRAPAPSPHPPAARADDVARRPTRPGPSAQAAGLWSRRLPRPSHHRSSALRRKHGRGGRLHHGNDRRRARRLPRDRRSARSHARPCR